MMKSAMMLLAAALLSVNAAFGWGKQGHDAVAYIAECNLTPKAKKNIEKYLGHSIVYYAAWMDEFRMVPEYAHTSKWHTAAVDKSLAYRPKPQGDAITCTEDAIAKLRNRRNIDDSTVVVSLKLLTHLLGDIHCPSHINYPDTPSIKITIEGKPYRYHTIWDGTLLGMRHRWGYVEFGHQLDRCTKREKQAIMAGTPREWFHDSAVYCQQIFGLVEDGQVFNKVSDRDFKDFLIAGQPIVERQILYAGYRLAKVLNDLFG